MHKQRLQCSQNGCILDIQLNSEYCDRLFPRCCACRLTMPIKIPINFYSSLVFVFCLIFWVALTVRANMGCDWALLIHFFHPIVSIHSGDASKPLVWTWLGRNSIGLKTREIQTRHTLCVYRMETIWKKLKHTTSHTLLFPPLSLCLLSRCFCLRWCPTEFFFIVIIFHLPFLW